MLRGNSGCGKSTVALRLRDASDSKIALVEQDYLRRRVLHEKETKSNDNIELIRMTVEFALSRNYDVILEGILHFPRYGAMLADLAQKCPRNYFYYLDASLEETLKRHASKPNAHEFGQRELTAWYQNHDVTNFANEIIIPESSTEDQTVLQILHHCNLPLPM